MNTPIPQPSNHTMELTPILIDRATVVRDLGSVRDARDAWVEVRRAEGLSARPVPLLTEPEHSPKTIKNSVPTPILHLAPATNSVEYNVCAFSTTGCRVACYWRSGRGKMPKVRKGRLARTLFFGRYPEHFVTLLAHEIGMFANRRGVPVAVRLNGTSDIRWERVAPVLFDRFPETERDRVRFYDYTKVPNRTVPDHYRLTWSLSERDGSDIRKAMNRYGTLAVVVDTPAPKGRTLPLPLPGRWHGYPTVDGDASDLREEPSGTVVLLRAKGHAIGDPCNGFVRPTVA